MLVTMRQHITGTRDEAPWPNVGESIELPDHEAEHLITAGYAEPFEETPADATEPDERDDGADAQGDSDAAGNDGDSNAARQPRQRKARAPRSS